LLPRLGRGRGGAGQSAAGSRRRRPRPRMARPCGRRAGRARPRAGRGSGARSASRRYAEGRSPRRGYRRGRPAARRIGGRSVAASPGGAPARADRGEHDRLGRGAEALDRASPKRPRPRTGSPPPPRRSLTIRPGSTRPRPACSTSAPSPASTGSIRMRSPLSPTELGARLAALEAGEQNLAALEARVRDGRAAYEAEAARLTALRSAAAARLDSAVAGELAPLKLDSARFRTLVEPLGEAQWAARGPTGRVRGLDQSRRPVRAADPDRQRRRARPASSSPSRSRWPSAATPGR
jgi:hypothetical protein